jgi:hypothetical protein
MKAMTKLGRSLDCIAGDFAADLTPCAPNGAYALSAGTGSASIVKIVDRWQDYMYHSGGVTSHFAGSQIHFGGGFVGSSHEEAWSFTVSRLTGVGELKQPSKPTMSYTCNLQK